MYLVIIAWLYVVLMMAAAEAMSNQGTLLGAVFTLLLYGLLPLGVVAYILGTPGRKRRLAREVAESKAASDAKGGDGGSHAPGGAGSTVAPERKEV